MGAKTRQARKPKIELGGKIRRKNMVDVCVLVGILSVHRIQWDKKNPLHITIFLGIYLDTNSSNIMQFFKKSN